MCRVVHTGKQISNDFAKIEPLRGPWRSPDGPSPGCRNLLRAGFKQASVRTVRRREGGRPRSRHYEADAVAVDEAGRVLAVGSCKWPGPGGESRAHGADELAKLEVIREELQAPSAPMYFFDRVAFSARLLELAVERDDVRLIPASDLA